LKYLCSIIDNNIITPYPTYLPTPSIEGEKISKRVEVVQIESKDIGVEDSR
jgi:hypothetical protein